MLSKLKAPNSFPSIQDIMLYHYMFPTGSTIINSTGLRMSTQFISAELHDIPVKLLDCVIRLTTPGGYKLQKLDDTLSLMADPPIERSSSGNIAPGNYLILPSVEGGQIMFLSLNTFSNVQISSPTAKRLKCDGGSVTSESCRDSSDDSQSFKMRLVNRDKGCVVCLATGIQKTYKYLEDSGRYEGAHIIGFAYREIWDTKRFSELVNDPFTDPANANSPLASTSTRTKKDFRRINSLENGILLCVEHHKDFDNFRFTIHHETRKIFAFHPDSAALQGVEVKAPWDSPDVLFPPPHPLFLNMHYSTSIAKAMKASEDDDELDDDDEDYEGPSELEEVQDEQVRIWLGDLSPSTSFDFMADNKGNIGMLADMRVVDV